MSEPFLAEIRQFGFNFPPRGWAQCDGQILPINQNQALFSLLGTTYGGDGRTTFALPDLRGRSPLHEGSGFNLGSNGGAENVVLTVAEMPTHSHAAENAALRAAPGDADTTNPAGNSLAKANIYSGDPPSVDTNAASVGDTTGNAGGGQGHNNMAPFLAINFCIALTGLFPSRN
jgi:microcystin-dependent protein